MQITGRSGRFHLSTLQLSHTAVKHSLCICKWLTGRKWSLSMLSYRRVNRLLSSLAFPTKFSGSCCAGTERAADQQLSTFQLGSNFANAIYPISSYHINPTPSICMNESSNPVILQLWLMFVFQVFDSRSPHAIRNLDCLGSGPQLFALLKGQTRHLDWYRRSQQQIPRKTWKYVKIDVKLKPTETTGVESSALHRPCLRACHSCRGQQIRQELPNCQAQQLLHFQATSASYIDPYRPFPLLWHPCDLAIWWRFSPGKGVPGAQKVPALVPPGGNPAWGGHFVLRLAMSCACNLCYQGWGARLGTKQTWSCGQGRWGSNWSTTSKEEYLKARCDDGNSRCSMRHHQAPSKVPKWWLVSHMLCCHVLMRVFLRYMTNKKSQHSCCRNDIV